MNNYIYLVYPLLMGVIAYGVIKFERARKPERYEFDERQQMVKCKAHKYSNYAIFVSLLLFSFTEILFERKVFEFSFFAFLIISVGITVQKTYEIINDSYFSVKYMKKGILRNVLDLLAYMIFPIFMIFKSDGKMIDNGILTIDAVPVLMIISVLIVATAYLVKYMLTKNEAKK